MRYPSALTPLAWLLVLAGCSADAPDAKLPGGDDTSPYAGLGEGERLQFTGTEPFWGGEVSGATLVYRTPGNDEGTAIPVERFAGRGGLSFSGALAGRSLDMAVTPGECSDGMSDRTYPFVITLALGDDLLSGCGWTDARPFTVPGEGG